MPAVPKCSEKQWDRPTEQTESSSSPRISLGAWTRCMMQKGATGIADRLFCLQSMMSTQCSALLHPAGPPAMMTAVWSLHSSFPVSSLSRFTKQQLCSVVLAISFNPVCLFVCLLVLEQLCITKEQTCMLVHLSCHHKITALWFLHFSLSFFFFFLQRSTTSAVKGCSIIRRSSAWNKYKSCKNYALCGETWCCF